MEDDWRTQEARNQTTFREINEWSKEDADARDGLDRLTDTYLCECGDSRCTVPIHLTPAEYEDVRKEPTRFVIALDHENPEIDILIAEHERYAVIEKSFGTAAMLARASDPRQ